MRRLFAACLFAVVAVGLPSQATLLVGPGGFAQIRDALAAAAPGDVVVVQPGTYWNFLVDRGVTIRAETPGTVDVGFDVATPQPGRTSVQPPAGEVAHVVGLRFLPSVVLTLTLPFRHSVYCTGDVRFDGCEFLSNGASPLRCDGGTLHLQDCTATSQSLLWSTALEARSCTLTIVGGEFVGPAGLVIGAFDAAVVLDNVVLHGSGFTARAVGNSASMRHALSGVDSGQAWISDAVLEGAGQACALSPTCATVRLARCTLLGYGAGCPAGVATPALVGVARPQPLTVGAVFALDYTTAPNGFVATFASDRSLPNGIPLTVQPGLLDPATLFVAGLTLTDASGAGSAAWTIPNDPALVDRQLWLQGVGGSSLQLPLQACPVVGGVVR